MDQKFFDIDPRLEKLGEQAQLDCAPAFARTEEIGEYNSRKVLAAFIHNGVSESHFAGSTGYGYDDRGRETLEAVMAEITGSEDALVRHHFVSGTHTLTTALFGVLRPGDVMLSITGLPYDTIQPVIGIRGENCGSLKEFGIEYRQVNLLPDGTPDIEAISEAVRDPRVKVAYVQRSRGYSLRPSINMTMMEQLIRAVRQNNPKVIFMVDNCYGIFTEKLEPTQLGADLIVGSLIKNAGGESPHRRIHCRAAGFDRTVRIPPDHAGAGKRDWLHTGRTEEHVSGAVFGPKCGLQGGKNGDFCRLAV